MKKLIWLCLVASALSGYGQGCPEYASLLKEGDGFTAQKQYRKALNKYNAARLCAPARSAEVDRKVSVLFDAIEKEKDEAVRQRNAADKAKELSETNIRKLSDLVGIVTNIIQDEKYSGILGLTPLKTELLSALIPANQFISSHSKNEIVPWRSAEVHLQLGLSYEDIGKSIDSEKEVVKAYAESRQMMEELLKREGKIPEELTYIYLRAVLYHTWNLITKHHIGEAQEIIDFTERTVLNLKFASAKQFHALAGLANVQSRLYSILNKDSLAFVRNEESVRFSRMAVRGDTASVRYKTSLITHLNNLSIGNRLPERDRMKLKEESCSLAYSIDSVPGNGSLVTASIVQCVIDNSYRGDQPIEVRIQDMIRVINRISNIQFFDPHSSEYAQHLARLHLRLSDMYEGRRTGLHGNDSLSGAYRDTALGHFRTGFDNWRKYYASTTSIQDLWKTKNSYNSIIKLTQMFNIPADTCYNLLQSLVGAFESNISSYGKVLNIAEITARAYGKLAELALNKTKKDTTMALQYLDNAATHIEVILREKKFTEYDEYYADYCKTFTDRISIYISQGKTADARAAYKKLFEVFLPVYEKYAFDFYIGQHFWGSAFRMGGHLFQKGYIREAKPILEYASYHGMGESTKLLSQIYRDGLTVNKDPVKADSLNKLAGWQVMKKFTIPCDFAGVKAPFDVYVRQLPPDYPYKGIEDQAEWLLQARGGVIPKEVRESFIKLQELAWKNNVSFPELCVYALNAANEEKAKDTTSTGKNKDRTKLKENGAVSEDGGKDSLAASKTLDQLMVNLKLYIHMKDTIKAKITRDQILATGSGVETKYEIYNLYMNQGVNDFDSLFLKDASKLKTYRDYFMAQKTGEFVYYPIRRVHYYNMVTLDETYLKTSPADSVVVRKQMSQHYNSLAWYCLLTKRFENVLTWLSRSREADQENLYVYSNLPHAYLFTDQVEKAKELYLKFRDIPFNKAYPTFREAFLADFKEFEEEGLHSPYLAEIKELLTKNP